MEKELSRLLYSKGKNERLRKQLIAFLVYIEKLRDDLKLVENSESEYLNELIREIESLINDFTAAQKVADRTIISLKNEHRKTLLEKLPGIFELFGWQEKIDENGELKDND